MAGSHEDAMLIVELAKWGAAIDLGAAASAIWDDDFDPDTAEMTDRPVQTLLTFYETIGTFVKNGLLDRDLVYDWVWSAGVWDRVSPAVARARERTGVPQLFENFEALAAGQRQPTAAIP